MDTFFAMYTTYYPEIQREQLKKFLNNPECKDLCENEIEFFKMWRKGLYLYGVIKHEIKQRIKCLKRAIRKKDHWEGYDIELKNIEKYIDDKKRYFHIGEYDDIGDYGILFGKKIKHKRKVSDEEYQKYIDASNKLFQLGKYDPDNQK